MLELTSDQRGNIQRYMDSFISFLSTPKANEWKVERNNRSSYVKLKLSKDNIDKLTEVDFKIIFLNLYATQVWTNKDYAFNNVLSNGFDNLRAQLKDLIYGEGDIALRYDKFKSNIKHMGPATITEILTLLDADKYCLWNVKPRSVLPFLKIRGDIPKKAFDYNAFDGNIYKSCIEIMQAIRNEIKGKAVPNPDLWDTDFFIAYVFYNVGEFKSQPEERDVVKASQKQEDANIAIEEEEIEHTAAEFLLLKIGKLLGYDTYTADPSQEYKGEKLGDIATVSDVTQFIPPQSLGSARRIDVIWFRDDALVY
ncbi:MAG TPA: hypothetical protein VJH90_04350, partial [archaeon]|nr:hypothetical protein [archaeon]